MTNIRRDIVKKLPGRVLDQMSAFRVKVTRTVPHFFGRLGFAGWLSWFALTGHQPHRHHRHRQPVVLQVLVVVVGPTIQNHLEEQLMISRLQDNMISQLNDKLIYCFLSFLTVNVRYHLLHHLLDPLYDRRHCGIVASYGNTTRNPHNSVNMTIQMMNH